MRILNAYQFAHLRLPVKYAFDVRYAGVRRLSLNHVASGLPTDGTAVDAALDLGWQQLRGVAESSGGEDLGRRERFRHFIALALRFALAMFLIGRLGRHRCCTGPRCWLPFGLGGRPP